MTGRDGLRGGQSLVPLLAAGVLAVALGPGVAAGVGVGVGVGVGELLRHHQLRWTWRLVATGLIAPVVFVLGPAG